MNRTKVLKIMHSNVITLIAAMLAVNSAQARSTGIVGFSGEDGFYCNTCHSGGVAPDVRFEGPTAVAAGQTAFFRFVVSSHAAGQPLAGFNVSGDSGTLGTAPEDTGARSQVFANAVELTHTRPRSDDTNGEASWLFTWQAPEALGDVTLFGAGNSVDGFGDESGDESATTTIDIQVYCAGDCSDDAAVTVDELVTGIGIALGGEPLDDCPLVDSDGDGSVSISDLVAAVDSAVNGCP